MFRRFLVVTAVAAASSMSLLAGQAGAMWWNVSLPVVMTPGNG